MRRLATLALMGTDEGVERSMLGGAPTAFRIWRAGENPTDHGMTVFSDRSAEMLLAEQATRGNLYSIDVDHLSLKPDAPVEARKAVGWHRLEVREGELWAVDVQWTDAVRGGIEKSPPEWRYFSPAYDVDPQTNEAISYLNTALTNNPATHWVTALASRAGSEKGNADARERKGIPMTHEEIMAGLTTLANGEDASLAEKARKAMKAMMPEQKGEPDGDEGGEKKEEPKEEKKDAAAAKEEESKKDSAGEDEESKKSVAAARTVAELAEVVKQQGDELASFRKEREDRERAALIASKRVDEKVAAVLATKPLAVVREIIAAMPEKPKADPTAAEKVTATRGAGQGGTTSTTSSPELVEIDRRMGLGRRDSAIQHRGVHSTYAAMTRDEARRMLATLEKKGKEATT